MTTKGSFQDEPSPAPDKGAALDVPAGAAASVTPSMGSGPAATGCCGKTKQFFLYDSDRRDVQAFYFNQFGRSVLFISFMFLSLAILQLANEQAGCPKDENGNFTDCGNTVYGLRPSSMLSMMAAVGGIATSFFMPYAGAVVDFSDNRLRFGRAMAIIFTLINVVQIFLFPSTWFAITILQAIVASASFYGNSMVMWSYVTAPNDEELHGITGSGRLWEAWGMLIFFIVVAAVQVATPWDAVGIARFSQILASVVGGTCLFLCYIRYEKVRSVKKLGEGESMYIAGLKTMWNTMKVLRKEEPAVQRYLYGYVFLASAMASFTNLAITYLSEQVRMTATEIVIFILLNLLINPLGVLVHRIVANRIGHKKNYLLVNSFMLILAGLWTGIIAGPDQKPIAYLFAALFGIAYGWYYPSSNGFYVSIVPKEKVMELWGFNMFMSTILSWGPPLLFTVLNEATGELRLGMLGLISFQIIGIFFACFIPVDTEETPGKTTPISESSSVQQSA